MVGSWMAAAPLAFSDLSSCRYLHKVRVRKPRLYPNYSEDQRCSMAVRQVIFLSRSLTPHPHVHGAAAESELTAGSQAAPSLRVFCVQHEMFGKILIWNLGHASFYFEIILNITQCKNSNKKPIYISSTNY